MSIIGERTPSERGAPHRADDVSPVVYWHIGAPKTGTTYLQNVLWRNREALREDGVLYPGRMFAAHVYAAFDLRRAGFYGQYRDPVVPGAWPRLVDEARAWGGTVIISQELFCPATPKQIDRAMDALGFADVHLIYTARDLLRQIPAAWQEDIKNRYTLSLAEFVDSLRVPLTDAHPQGRNFWRMQDAVEVLRRWSRWLAPERVHVVTVPPPSAPSGLLWERFARLVGLDKARYDTAVPSANPSLGAAEACLLRRVNLALDQDIPWPVYGNLVKHYLAQRVLARRQDPIKITLPADAAEWAVARSKELVDGLRDGGYDVVGDLEELVPVDHAPSRTAEPPANLQLDAAVDGVAGLLKRVAQMGGEDKLTHSRFQQLEQELARCREKPVSTLVAELGARLRR